MCHTSQGTCRPIECQFSLSKFKEGVLNFSQYFRKRLSIDLNYPGQAKFFLYDSHNHDQNSFR